LLVLGSELVVPDNIVSVYTCINWTEQGGTGDEAGDASASERRSSSRQGSGSQRRVRWRT
jgi:hypothetical protein